MDAPLIGGSAGDDSPREPSWHAGADAGNHVRRSQDMDARSAGVGNDVRAADVGNALA
jgi:hypothetical protein